MTENRPMRVMFYVQHLLGIGHLARASRIADALAAAGNAVTMVTGGTPVAGFPSPGIAHVALPALVAGPEGFSSLNDENGQPASDAYKAARRERLLATYDALKPDAVIIEAFPFGRRQVRFELLPLLERTGASRPRPVVAASIRDILQEKTKPGRDEETVALVRRHFDVVLVHGDPGFARLEDSFRLSSEITDRVRYTGVVAPLEAVPSKDRFDIVVSAGGGAVGERVLNAAAGAASMLDPSLTWLLIAGPNLPAASMAALEGLAPSHARIERFRTDFTGLLANARLSISQAGYNTVGDILLAGCRSILVPFTAGGETEQQARASRLAALGRAIVIDEDSISAPALAAAVTAALALPDPQAIALDRDGARGTARILRELVDTGQTAWDIRNKE